MGDVIDSDFGLENRDAEQNFQYDVGIIPTDIVNKKRLKHLSS